MLLRAHVYFRGFPAAELVYLNRVEIIQFGTYKEAVKYCVSLGKFSSTFIGGNYEFVYAKDREK